MSDQLAIAGIVISVVLGVGGYFIAKKVISNRQSQNVRNGSAIQAGRDVKIDRKIN